MARTLYNIPGTVSQVFTDHLHEINFEAPLPELKSQIIGLLQSEEIKRTCGADKFIGHIQKLNNHAAILSTVTTYVTCVRVKPSNSMA